MNFSMQQDECMVNIEHIVVVTRQREKLGLFFSPQKGAHPYTLPFVTQAPLEHQLWHCGF